MPGSIFITFLPPQACRASHVVARGDALSRASRFNQHTFYIDRNIMHPYFGLPRFFGYLFTPFNLDKQQ